VTDIDAIFITHFHSDHVGGLEEFLQRCYFRLENGVHAPHRPLLLMTPEQEGLFQDALSIGLTTDGRTIHDFCTPVLVENNSVQLFDHKIDFIDTTDLHCKEMRSYAFSISTNENNFRNVIFSGDIKHLAPSGILSHVSEHTLAIFQDIQLFHAKDGVHAELSDIQAYYPSELTDRIYLMHVSDTFEEHEKNLLALGYKCCAQQETYQF
jgi:hypothetical protein